MKLAVVGSRDFDDYDLVQDAVLTMGINYGISDFIIISGGAKGADSLAKKLAVCWGYPLIEFLPDWRLHGLKAGYLRNKQIVDECDYLIAFWDGKSKGTKHSIDLAERAGKLYKIIKY